MCVCSMTAKYLLQHNIKSPLRLSEPFMLSFMCTLQDNTQTDLSTLHVVSKAQGKEPLSQAGSSI